MNTIKLTDDALLRLGLALPKPASISEVLNTAILDAEERLRLREAYEISESQARLVQGVVAEAVEKKLLVFRHAKLNQCGVCEAKPSHILFKSGRRKGQVRKRCYLRGYELASRFISAVGFPTLGACSSCIKELRPVFVAELKDVRAEIPESLTGFPSRWVRWQNVECAKCRWRGHEGDLGELPTLIGRGSYRGECPECGAKNLPFGGTEIRRLSNQFTVVEAA